VTKVFQAIIKIASMKKSKQNGVKFIGSHQVLKSMFLSLFANGRGQRCERPYKLTAEHNVTVVM